jgi:hypothetical protein
VQQGNNLIAPALQLDIDQDVADGNTAWQGRLVYEPYQNGHATVVDGQWENQNALNGTWWFSNSSAFGGHCPISSPCTLSTIEGFYPNIGIRNVGGGGVSFKAGSGWTSTFVGNIDEFIFNDTTYDFDIAPPDTSGFVFTGSPKYVRANNGGDESARILVSNQSTDARFYVDGSSTPITGTLVGPSTATTEWWKLNTALSAGQHTITAQVKIGASWYDVNGTGTAYSIDAPWAEYVIPQANQYFRIDDKVVRVKADDEFNQFNFMKTTINSVTYTVNRADCNDQGSYVLCDLHNLNLPEGTYQADTTIYTKANNRYDHLISPEFTIDNTRPVLSNFQITDVHSVYGNNVSASADATDANGVKNVEFYITAPRAGDGVCDGNGTKLASATDTTAAGNTYTATLDTSSLNGDYCINAIAEDVAANHSSILRIKANFDNTDPDAPTLQTPENNSYINYNDFYFEWTDVSDAVSYEAQFSQNPAVGGDGAFQNVQWTGDYQGNQPTDSKARSVGANGTWYWQVRAVDAASNKSDWTTPWKVTIDLLAPGVPNHVSPSNNAFKTTANQTSIDWEDVLDTSPVTYKYQSSLSSATNPDGSFSSPAYTSGAISDSEIPTPETPEGKYYWHVKAVDAAGNESAWSNPWVITVDNTAPATPTPSLAAGDYTGNQSVELSSNDSLSGLKDIYYTTDGDTPDSNSTLYSGPISITEDTILQAIAYDNSGNASSVMSATYGIAPVIDGEQAIQATTSSITITWTTDQPATSRVIYDTVPHSSLGSAPNYGYAHSTTEDSNKVTDHSVTVTGLTPGTLYYFRTVSHGSPETVSDQISANTKKKPSTSSSSPSTVTTQSTNNNGGGTTGGTVAVNVNTGNNNGAGGQILAANNNDGTGNPASNNNGQVKSDSTTADVKSDSTTDGKKGISLWWLLILLIPLTYYFWRKRKISE